MRARIVRRAQAISIRVLLARPKSSVAGAERSSFGVDRPRFNLGTASAAHASETWLPWSRQCEN